MTSLNDPFARAVDALHRGKLSEAWAICDGLLARAVVNLRILTSAADAAWQKRCPSTYDFDEAYENDLAGSSVLLQVAFVHAILGDPDGAERCLERVLLTDAALPADLFRAQVLLGELATRRGLVDRAESCFAEAARMNPGHGGPFSRRSVLLLRSQWGVRPTPPAKTQTTRSERRVQMTALGECGRFGNQLFQYGFVRSYGHEHDLSVQVPDWIGRYLFDLDDPFPDGELPIVYERGCNLVASLLRETPEVFAECDLAGYLAHPTRCFAPHKDLFRTLFRPGRMAGDHVGGALERLRSMGKTVVAIHIRHGDFGQGAFWVAPSAWYLNWLGEIWSRLQSPVLFVATDDPSALRDFAAYAPVTSDDLATPLVGAEFYTDFHILSQADYLAISNSTFSLMASMLNEWANTFVRPEPLHERLVPFDPWDTEIFLKKPES